MAVQKHTGDVTAEAALEAALGGQSYYAETVMRPPPGAPLDHSIKVDVAVVGGGLAGLSAAVELAGIGYSVAVMEARVIGWGASGRNGGQVLVGFAGLSAVERQLQGNARLAWDMSVEGVRLVRDRIDRYQIDCDYRAGHLTLATGRQKALGLRRQVRHMQQAYGHRLRFLDEGEVRGWIASSKFHGGAFDGGCGHLNPLKYCLALGNVARDLGVQVFEDTAVASISRGEPHRLHTAAAEVTARYVVLAGNAYLDRYPDMPRDFTHHIIPVGTFIIATEPMVPARAEELIRDRVAAFDTNFVLDYFRLTPDNRLLFGGADVFSGQAPPDIREHVRARMLDVFPQLADLAVTHAWGGYVDATMNSAPDFGRMEETIYYLQGFSGHGVALTGLAGRVVAEAIAGRPERFSVFQHLRHLSYPRKQWARTLAVRAGVTLLRVRDRLTSWP